MQVLCTDFSNVIVEAYQVAARIQLALKELYGCQKVAVCMIGNLTRDEHGSVTNDERYEHRHFHIIPTYAEPVDRYGLTFVDNNYAKPMNLDPNHGYKKQPVNEQLLMQVRDDIRKALALMKT